MKKIVILEIPEGAELTEPVVDMINFRLSKFKNRDGKTIYEGRGDRDTGIYMRITDRNVSIDTEPRNA